MKSKKIIIGLLVLTLLTPTIVKADMDAPKILLKDAVIAKEEGADYYDQEGNWPNYKLVKKGHYDKGTKIKSNYEMKEDGIKYIQTCEDEYTNCHYVKASDVLPGGGAISPTVEGSYKSSTPISYKIAADEVEIKEGPAASYKTVGKLVKGFRGKYSYSYDAYIYIEENGVKGWVDTLDRQVLTPSSDLITAKEIDTDCGKIPANTILTNVWDAAMWDHDSLIKYNGKECYVETLHSSDFYGLLNNPKNETTTDTGKLYKTGDKQGFITNVPKGTTLKILTYYDSEDNWEFQSYVEYNGTKGWYFQDLEEKSTSTPEPTNTPEPTATPVPTDEPDDIAPAPESKENGMDTMTIIIMCCIGAIAVALTALVTIILVNKKNKKKIKELEGKLEEEKNTEEAKAEEPVEEIKIEEPTEIKEEDE